MRVSKLVICVCNVALAAASLNYSIPAGWVHTSVTVPYSELSRRAQQAINVMRSQYWPDPTKVDFGWGTGTTLTALAYKDNVASTKDNHGFVKAVLDAAKKHNSHFDPYCYNDDAQWWGTAAMFAYRAYGDKEFLQYAKDVWDWVHPSQITEAEAKAGKSGSRAGQIPATCDGKTIAGAVFWRSPCAGGTHLGVNVITTALFETLSAYLAETTGDKKYIDAAKSAYNFITTHMMKTSPNIPTDGLDLPSCKQNGWIFTYNTGKFVEGAVVLSHVTKDDKYKNQALKTVVDAVRLGSWNDKQGHLTEGQSGDPAKGNDGRQFKSIFVRALTEVGRREYQNSGLRTLLKRYINIQYDSATRNSTDGKGNYGLKWTGPYDGAHSSSQMNILDLLVAGIEYDWNR